MVEKVNYGLIAGELRKAARQYEVFQHAAEAADVLNAFDKEKKALEKDIAGLKAEKVELDAACDKIYNDAELAKQDIAVAKEQAEAIILAAKKAGEHLTKEARDKAEKISTEAISNVDNINAQATEAIKAKNAAISRQEEAEKTLAKVEKQLEDAKQRILSI